MKWSIYYFSYHFKLFHIFCWQAQSMKQTQTMCYFFEKENGVACAFSAIGATHPIWVRWNGAYTEHSWKRDQSVRCVTAVRNGWVSKLTFLHNDVIYIHYTCKQGRTHDFGSGGGRPQAQKKSWGGGVRRKTISYTYRKSKNRPNFNCN